MQVEIPLVELPETMTDDDQKKRSKARLAPVYFLRMGWKGNGS